MAGKDGGNNGNPVSHFGKQVRKERLARGWSLDELAGRTGTAERYVREWLNAQAAGGFVEYDPASGRYTLPPEQTVALTDSDSPAYLPGFFQVAVGSVLGAVAHGFTLPAPTRELLWQPLYLALGVTMALFVVGAVRDWRGDVAARRTLGPMLVLAVVFYGITRLTGGDFLAFVVYEAGALLFSLVVYARLASGERPRDLTGDESIAYDMAAVLNRGHQVPNSTYDAAVAAFGVPGVAEIAYFVGCYCLISSLLNTLDTCPFVTFSFLAMSACFRPWRFNSPICSWLRSRANSQRHWVVSVFVVRCSNSDAASLP